MNPSPGGPEALTALAALTARRSCRSYATRPVDDALLGSILDAGRRAPSAGNSAVPRLLVMRGPSETARYWNVTLPADRRARFRWPGLLRAPVLVVPLIRPDAYVARYGERDKRHSGLGAGVDAWSVPYWWVDGGAAMMAMLVAATSLSVDSLFFGQFGHETALASEFGWDVDERALGTIALGYGDGGDERSLSARRGRRPIDEVIVWSDSRSNPSPQILPDAVERLP